ncbi:MAG: hypothetical protein FD180_91 [Planctomycetota bacterium]|nr:MAG: hypothetical protein FD180_91 [Planctomycetota bacterium]
MVERSGYSADLVGAARSVLIEVAHILGEYRKNSVLVGGWVPCLLLPDSPEPHVGSLDVDLALDIGQIGAARYNSLLKTLENAGYSPSGKADFQYVRQVRAASGRIIRVPLDLLAGEYGGRGKRHQTQRIQNLKARKARGADLVFKNADIITLTGELPDGRKDKVALRVASPVAFLSMKGMALAGRTDKPKDAHDIAFLIRNWPGGIPKLAPLMKGLLKNRLVQEGLGKIRAKFRSPDDFGPVSITAFAQLQDREARQILARESYETVTALLDALGIEPWTGL